MELQSLLESDSDSELETDTLYLNHLLTKQYLVPHSTKKNNVIYPMDNLKNLPPAKFKQCRRFKSHIVSTLNAAFCVNGFDPVVYGLGLGKNTHIKALNLKPSAKPEPYGMAGCIPTGKGLTEDSILIAKDDVEFEAVKAMFSRTFVKSLGLLFTPDQDH
ncbi:hypothetical protein PPACK8108_LOCUS7518 [Phakopsora pachyrhizi]|uniref:Uncharacterized protein n=1 Tax=Phakopsora pachyrhizi TaxID=170000 RepID=A0AAV0AUU7_PHAPC|nr:hypothetical protein PPACK8108_LOCUS7518 [Phakopsora pachyrhizi]